MIQRNQPLDVHSEVHILGCYGAVFLWYIGFHLTLTNTMLLVLAAGFLWECLDEVCARLNWDVWFFDNRGFGWLDILCDMCGITCAYLTILLGR